MANRHQEFLDRGARVFAISADTASMNAAVVEKMALPFPILSDVDRDQAITPMGFADEKDPREIARPGAAVISPEAEVVYSWLGRDYADRPLEDILLEELDRLGLDSTDQTPPELGEIEAGDKAMPFEGLSSYLRGAKFAGLAIRSRYRDSGEDFADDLKRYVEMLDRYLEALPGVEERKA
jgi:AhpC/TSA family